MNKTCEKCDKRPNFNVKGSEKGRFCHEHKEEGMVDVTHKTCEKCETRATYGYPGKSVQFCFTHRKVNTLTNPRKRCSETKCRNIAIFGIDSHERCENHKLSTDINILERLCVSCGLLGLLDTNFHCETCDPETFKKRRLRKQNEVQDYLLAHGITFTSIDKIIDGGVCGKERPDFYIDCGSHVLIIEVDENQHSGRACECEQTRMVNVSQSNGMPTVFLRYNPDKYKVKKGNRVENNANRLKHLLDWTKCLQKRIPTAFLQVMYLFFDYYEKEENMTIIIPFEE